MPKVKFGDVVKEVKNKIDRNNNPYEYYVAGDHMDSEDLTIHRRGCFATDDVGPAFIREFRKGQVLYGSRRTYLKKVAVADFDGVTANTTFVLETKDQNVLLQELLPFIMLTDNFTKWSIGKSKGSTNPYILFSDLADYEFDLPTIEEQRKLATVLWKMFRLKEGYVELQHQSDQLVQSQFIEMFGNPNDTQTEFVVTDALEIRDDLRKPLNDGVRSTMYEGTLYPYYGANGKVDEINQYLMDCDAICLAEDCGSYGAGEPSSYIVSGKVWVNNHAHILIPKANCNIRFANEYFRLLDITQYISGTTRAKLTQGQLKILPMMIPDIEKQEAFCALIEQFDKSKFAAKQALENLERTQKSLMNRYLG